MDERRFVVYDNEGYETEMQILFTFETDDDVKYVIFHPVNDDSEYIAGRYTEDGQLFTDLNDEEFEMCSEMLNTFMDQIEFDEEANS